MKRCALAAVVLALAAACGAVRVEGECVYTRKTESSYQCKPDGKVETIRTHEGSQ